MVNRVLKFDGSILATTESGRFVVDVIPVNTPPVATSDTFSVDQDTQYSGAVSATDADGDTLLYYHESNADVPLLGIVVMQTDGTFTYDPPSGYFGPDQFTFSADDGRGGTGHAVIDITVTEVGGSPVLSISDVTGTSTGATSGEISITVNKACTIYWRMKSLTAPTDKETEFANTVEAVESGTYGPYPNGGTLAEDTLYYASAWAENIGDAEETAIVSDTFTTGAAVSAAPTNLRFSAGGVNKNVSETTPTGQVFGTVIADGTPTEITFTEDADPDNKFTVNSDGTVELLEQLVFATKESHTFDVIATNTEGSSSAQTFTINVTATSSGSNDDSGDPPATVDYSVASQTALNSLIDGWTITAGVIQVPGAASKVVQLTAPFSGDLNLSGRRFSHKLVVRSIGPYASTYNTGTSLYTDSVFTGSDISGGVNISNTENVELFRLCVKGGVSGGYAMAADNVTNSGFRKCWFYGTPYPIDIATNSGTDGYASRVSIVEGSNSFYFEHCFASCYYNSTITTNGTTGDVLRGNIAHALRHDMFKSQSGCTNKWVEENWACRTICRTASSSTDGAHTDFYQHQGSGTHSGGTYKWNVVWYGPRINAPWADSAYQGIFFGGTTEQSNLLFEQNNFYSAHVTQIGLRGSPTGCVARYNTVVPYDLGEGQGMSMPAIGGNSKDYNLTVCKSNYAAQAGVNGIAITNLGDVKQNTLDFTAMAALPHWTGIASDSTGFEIMLPSAGASDRAHWDNPNPVGCYELLERVFALGLHPGNRGWPVAQPWTHQYNANAGISSTYSGSYDSNGDNA